jgi:excisionase family DNA binding protein
MGTKKDFSPSFDDKNISKIYTESEKQQIISDFKAAKCQAEEKRIDDIFKKHEPYDLKEIEAIIRKVEKQNATRTPKDKVVPYHIALEKINLIIKNNESLFQRLQNEMYIDLEEYGDDMNAANSFKKSIEIKITELQEDASKQTQSNVVPENSQVMPEKRNVLFDVCGTTKPDKSDNGLMNIDEVAVYLRKSKSTIYHWVSKDKIPFSTVGRELRFEMEAIENRRKEGTLGKSENIKANNSHKIKKKKRHFTFQVPLEPFTNVFVQNEYLDKENAILMNAHFSREPKLSEKLIVWKGELKSLLTFFYLADRLGFIDKSMSSNVREHNSSSEEYEDEDERREIRYFTLRNIFTVSENSGSSESAYTRAWNGVNQAINDLRTQVASKKNIKKEDAKHKITRKETILYYFENNYNKSFKIAKTIDKKMLNIICELNKKNKTSASF